MKADSLETQISLLADALLTANDAQLDELYDRFWENGSDSDHGLAADALCMAIVLAARERLR